MTDRFLPQFPKAILRDKQQILIIKWNNYNNIL